MSSVQYCTIACDKGHITAHKLKLCEHSKYLQDILSKYPHAEHPIIILTELNIIDVKILVNYMYTGELVINSDSSPTSLLRAAQILKIDSLTAEDNDDEELPCDDSSESSNHHVADSSESSHHHVNESSPHQIHNTTTSSSNNTNNSSSHHHNSHLHNHLQDDMDDEDEDEDDEDDLRMDEEDAGNSHSRLINSIKNIYSLNQNFHSSSADPEQSLLGVASSNSNHQQAQQFVESLVESLGSNPKHNNHTPNSLSQHLQQQLSSHLDLQDLQDSQDSKQVDKNNKIRCHLCNIGLSDVKCLYRHVLTRHLPEKWGYKCEFCDREFSRDDHLMRHYTTKHKNMEFDREKIRETRRLNREMAKNFHDQISTV